MDSTKTMNKLADKFLSNLVFQGARYAALSLIKNNNLSLVETTNNYWKELYYETNPTKYCHLIEANNKIAEKQNSFTMIWDLIAPNNEMSNIMNEIRIKNHLCHGVSFVEKSSSGYITAIHLASKYGDLSFTQAVIENKTKILSELKKIISK